MVDVFLSLVTFVGLIGAFALLIAFNPEKIEKWASIINRIFAGFGTSFNFAHKRYVKHDLQSRINEFTKRVSTSAPYFDNTKVSIQWTEKNLPKKAFLEEGKVILRLRSNDPEDENFVHGAYWVVSTQLLPKMKRYVAPYQRQALDLYVTSKIIEKEKHHVIENFLEHYLHPYMEKNSKITDMYQQFDKIDKYGVFYSVLLQELYFLSMKVYGGPKNNRIVSEVAKLVDFLEKVSSRVIGEEVELNFRGEFSRFAIVIIGKPFKMSLEGTDPYTNFIRRDLVTTKAETIYLLGRYEHREFIDEVCNCLPSELAVYKKHRYIGTISRKEGKSKIEEYLIVLRASGIDLFQPH